MEIKVENLEELLKLKKDIQEDLAKGNISLDKAINYGIRYRQLDSYIKRNVYGWEDLNNEIGHLFACGEAYRNKVFREIKNNHRIEQNLSYNKNEIKENVSDEDGFEKQLAELYKERTKARDTFNSYRRLLREDARIESFKESIINAIKTLPPLPAVDDLVITHNGAEAILMIADMHIGVKCNNFYNKYDSTIAYKRLMKTIDTAIAYCKLHNVTRLNVLNMGDNIHGIIHTNARIEQEFDVTQQIITAAEYLVQALDRLQRNVNAEIHYYSVLDNHSRVIANKSEHIEKENLSKIIDWHLRTRFLNEKGCRIIFEDNELDEGLGYLELNNGKKVVFAHGHEDNINNSFSNFIGATKQFIDYALLAHYHSEKMKSFQGFKVIVSGSLVGTEQYAISKRLFGSPSQTLLIFENGNLINVSIDLSNIII